ncbi:hypothetical protein Tco_0725459 [Tanacetum coccineum]|uniref:Reverse transcriptase Ty1/copia-type domain-containing protein n=1 Tax=Tanacetum coccineum TaxID=301880 RepID=A0ABQ4YEC7_9ASTR
MEGTTAPPQVPAPKRSSGNITTHVWLQDYVTPTMPRANQVSVTHVNSQFQAFMTALLSQTTHTSFKKAIQDKEWCLAMNDELRALELNDVYMKIPMGYTGEGKTVQDIPRSNKSFGYVQSKVDYSLFTKKDNTSFTFVMVYVDDLMITLVSLLKDSGIKDLGPVDLKCDNQAAIYIAANSIFHARTKHIEVDCQYVRDQVKAGTVKPSYVSSKAQVATVNQVGSFRFFSLLTCRGV